MISVTIVFGLLGIILVRLLPIQFNGVSVIMGKAVVKNIIVGFALIILFTFVILLSAITIIGLPISAFGLLVFLLGLMMSTFFVSFAIGKKILQSIKRSSASSINYILSFLIGFVILSLVFMVPVPYVGQIAQIVVVSLGFGSIYYTLRKKGLDLSDNQKI
ncbi:hypothetical protein [Candidatus Nitrosocosmicus arcticus]|uniref:Uncharacterized protein n=1 Tax=Candidatus Nitrosocosmicus arcticus TaxID=2035267 RepID=A0A557SX31_9ARCH|nr:hypothetical protein [Candidatus Nitrosocosmicus arcticus]TVP41154.1 conserved membrane protein of unknown function [Candidatus Nitrosocosmicus arcticus]